MMIIYYFFYLHNKFFSHVCYFIHFVQLIQKKCLQLPLKPGIAGIVCCNLTKIIFRNVFSSFRKHRFQILSTLLLSTSTGSSQSPRNSSSCPGERTLTLPMNTR